LRLASHPKSGRAPLRGLIRRCPSWDSSKVCPMKKAPQWGLVHGRCNVMRCTDDAFAQPQWMRQAVASETPASACITWRCRFRRGRSGLCEQLLRPGHARQRGRRWIGGPLVFSAISDGTKS
jgi:hypothetical protein